MKLGLPWSHPEGGCTSLNVAADASGGGGRGVHHAGPWRGKLETHSENPRGARGRAHSRGQPGRKPAGGRRGGRGIPGGDGLRRQRRNSLLRPEAPRGEKAGVSSQPDQLRACSAPTGWTLNGWEPCTLAPGPPLPRATPSCQPQAWAIPRPIPALPSPGPLT